MSSSPADFIISIIEDDKQNTTNKLDRRLKEKIRNSESYSLLKSSINTYKSQKKEKELLDEKINACECKLETAKGDDIVRIGTECENLIEQFKIVTNNLNETLSQQMILLQKIQHIQYDKRWR